MAQKNKKPQQTYGAEMQGAIINLPSSETKKLREEMAKQTSSESKKTSKETAATSDTHKRSAKDTEAIKNKVEKNKIQEQYKEVYELGTKVKKGTATSLEKAKYGAVQRLTLKELGDVGNLWEKLGSFYKNYDTYANQYSFSLDGINDEIKKSDNILGQINTYRKYAALYDEKSFDDINSLYGTVSSAKKHLESTRDFMKGFDNKEDYIIARNYSNFSSYEDLNNKKYELERQKEEMSRAGGFEREIAGIDKRLNYINENGYTPNVISTMGIDDIVKFEAVLENFEQQQYNPEISVDERRRYHNLYSQLSDEIRLRKNEIKNIEKWNKAVSEEDSAEVKHEKGKSDSVEYNAINYGVLPDSKKGQKQIMANQTVEDYLWAKNLTSAEKTLFNKIWNKYGEEKAHEYLTDLSPFLNKRYTQEKAEMASDFSADHKSFATAQKILTAPYRQMEGLVNNAINIGTAAFGGEIDPYSKRFASNHITNAAFESVKNEIDSPFWKFVYSAGVQAGELALTMTLAKGVGNVAGGFASSATKASQIASKVANITNQLLLSSNSMLETTLQYKENGESDLAAIGMGIISGAIEAWTERKSMSRLLKSPDIYKEASKLAKIGAWSKKVGIDAFGEGLEEIEANVYNTLAAFIFDQRDNDNFLIAYDNAVANGASSGEAFVQAAKAVFPEYVESFVVGALAGAGFSAVNTASSIRVADDTREIVGVDFVTNNREINIETISEYLVKNNIAAPEEAIDLAKTIEKKVKGEAVTKEENATIQDNPVLRGMVYGLVDAVGVQSRVNASPAQTEATEKTKYVSELDRLIHQPTLSNKSIEDIINNESARDEFQTLTGVNLKGTKAEMREAVKQWKLVEDYKQRQKENKGKKWVTVEESRSRKEKHITEGLAPMSHEEAGSLIAETQSEDTVSSQGRIGAKVISQAYDVNDENSLISQIMKDGYNESEASKIVDGIYSFMYARGRDGANLEDSLRAVESNLHPGVSEQARVFYEAGVMDSANWIRGKKNARVESNDVVKRLLKERKIDHRTIRAMNAIAKKLGIDIVFADNVDGDGEFNIETGVLRINGNAKNRFFITSVHESIHALRTIDPESYNKISDIVYEVLSLDASKYGKAWNEVLNRYRKEATDENGKLNKDYIREELNAKVISELLADPKFIKELAKQNRNLALRVVDMLVDLFDKMFVRYGEQSSATPEMRAAVDMLKSEARAIQLMYQNALKSTESVQGEKIELGLQEGIYNKKQSVEKNRDVFYNKDEYWHTDLTKRELKMLEGWIQRAGFPEHTKITDTANWYKGRLNGEPIFAIYSSVYVNNSTILYEVRGQNAIKELDVLLNALEVIESETSFVKRKNVINGILKDSWMQQSGNLANSNVGSGRGNSNTRNVTVYQGESSEFIGSKAFRNVVKNLFEIQYGEIRKSKSDTETDADLAVSAPAFRTTAQIRQSAFELREETKKRLESQVKKYGAIEKGEMPSRDVTLPKETDAGKVRTFQRTAIEADAVSNEAAMQIADNIANNALNSVYSVVSNKKVFDKARENFQARGFDSMINEWEALLESGKKIDKQDIANAMILVEEASKRGYVDTEVRILTQLAAEATAAGQSVQAYSMLKKLGANAQVYAVERMVQKVSRQVLDKYGKKVEVPEELIQRYKEALEKEKKAGDGNTETSDAVFQEIEQKIADQIPANWFDKWNAWRMFAMLGNIRTHSRNFFGNLLFWPVRFFKDIISASGQSLFIRDAEKRTKSLKGQFTRGEVLEYAKNDAKLIESVLRGESKYGEFSSIEQKKKIFGTNWIEKATKFAGRMLEAEDWIFLKMHYARALTNYIVTNNLDTSNISDEQLAKARKIAVLEAHKATFRDASILAELLNKAKNRSVVIGSAIDSAMPFKKTPINIIKRGVEYSPAGLIKTLAKALYDIRSGKLSAAEFIDGLAENLTGSGLMAIGWFLASEGVLIGAGDDDENENKLSNLIGSQNYAIKIFGGTYTLDWLAPAGMPLFVGCELQKLFEYGQIPAGEFFKAFARVIEPAFEMSMLESLNDIVKAAAYEETASAALGRIVMDIPLNYLGQGTLTLLSQLARTIDNTRRKTYIDKNGKLPDFVQSFVQQQAKRIPGLSFMLEPYVNAKGEVEKNAEGNIFSRFIQNFLSPGYYKKIKSTETDEEIARVYRKTRISEVIPKTAKKSISVDGEDYHLSNEQHSVYQQEMGKTYYNKAKDIISSDYYKSLSDKDKARLLVKAREYADDVGKNKAVPEYKIDNGWLHTAMETPGGYKFLIDTTNKQGFGEMDVKDHDAYTSDRGKLFSSILDSVDLPQDNDDFVGKFYKSLYEFAEDVTLEKHSDGQYSVSTKWMNEIKGLTSKQQAEYIYGKSLKSMYDSDALGNAAVNLSGQISADVKLRLLTNTTVISKSPQTAYREHNLSKTKISSEQWLDVYNKYNEITEITNPKNGKKVSKKEQIVAYINRQKLSREQKSAMYRALGYEDPKKAGDVPWGYVPDYSNPTDYGRALGKQVAKITSPDYNNDAKKGQCVWYARGRAKEKLSADLPAMGNANEMFANAKAEAKLSATAKNIKPNTLVTYKVGTSSAGQTAGHVIYIEDVEGDTVYYTEGGYGSNSGKVKKSTKEKILKGLSGNGSKIGTGIIGIIDVSKY